MSDPVPTAGEAISSDLDGVRSRSKRSGRPRSDTGGGRDRSLPLIAWYQVVRFAAAILTAVLLRWRSTGHRNVPETGAVLLVSNHLSYLDVFLLGISVRRPLNYVARSTLFLPVLGTLIRSVGAFPIQREGMGASGMKETLKRLRAGGIVTLFPEGTRSRDGELAALKSGIAVLVARAGVPVVPVGIVGTFEVLPRSRLVPVPHPIRIHFGRAIYPEELAGMQNEAVTALIRDRLVECRQEALCGLRRDRTY